MAATFDLLLATPGGQQTTDAYINHVLDSRATLKSRAIGANATLLTSVDRHRRGAVAHMQNVCARIVEREQRNLAPCMAEVRAARENVEIEAQASGHAHGGPAQVAEESPAGRGGAEPLHILVPAGDGPPERLTFT